MICSGSLKLLVLLALALSNTAAPLKSNLVRFYPISQSQYDAILRVTAGRPVISEGRLINSGFRTLNELRSSISNDISSGLRQILNVTGFLPASAKANTDKIDGYPLCVIKTSEVDDKDDDEDEDDAEMDTTLNQARAENDENDDANIEHTRPIVSCIVVVKSKDQEKQEEHIQQPHSVQKLRNHVAPYYYPPYLTPFDVYPAYHPFYNYAYLSGESRQNTAPYTVRRPAAKTTYIRRKATGMLRSANSKDISAETTKDTSTGRSGYSSYYPYSYGNYGNYYQQGYPYGPYYGGCHGNGYNYYGRHDDDDDDESGEEKNFSGEIGGEIGGHDF